MAVGSQIAIANVLADLNLAVWYGIALHIYASKKVWQILIWQQLEQTAKLPNLISHKFSSYIVSLHTHIHIHNIIGTVIFSYE